MILVLAYLGGVLTILSPCILPVLPFVFARTGQPFLRSTLPLLVGMAITFALVASLVTLGGSWAVQANQYGRAIALVVLAFFGLTLLLPALADRLTQPLVALGSRLSQRQSADGGWLPSLVLGTATGLLWAPCAGPILGLLLTGAALNGATAQTTLLLFAYAAGAASSLAAALLIGGRVFKAMKRSIGAGEWVRRGLGVAVLAGVAAIALGLDTGLLTQLSLGRTTAVEQQLIDRLRPTRVLPTAAAATPSEALPVEGEMPALDGAVQWLNSPPLTREGLKGKVVLVDFWTYSCINCLRTLPYVRAWAEKYRDQGLVVIGVHTPEFAFEKSLPNVQKALTDLQVNYPVAVDNDYAIWRRFNNEYWPAHYFVDAQGRIRHHHFGEGQYQQSEEVIRTLLAEAGQSALAAGYVKTDGTGLGLAPDRDHRESPETYLGAGRSPGFASTPVQQADTATAYRLPTRWQRNAWGLEGLWRVGTQQAALVKTPGRIAFRFHARDLHLVLGPAPHGKPVRYRVTLDGEAPGAEHGMDTAADGTGVVREQRLYQLIRQQPNADGGYADRTFTIEFLDPGVEAFAFTFG